MASPSNICTHGVQTYIMDKRVVFIDECADEQIYRSRNKIACADCLQEAAFRVYELDGTSWYWCGECAPHVFTEEGED